MIPELSGLDTAFRICLMEGEKDTYFLQFLHAEKWRFIPRLTATMGGEMLLPQECPTAITKNQAFQFVCNTRPRKKKLIRFARKYSNIREYFIRCNRVQYKLWRETEKQERLRTCLVTLGKKGSHNPRTRNA
jgi:hypothetical protein